MQIVDQKHKPIKIGTLILFLLAVITNNANLTFGLEISPTSLVILFFAVLININTVIEDTKSKIVLAVFIFSILTTFLFAKPIDFIKDTVFVLTLVAGFILARHCDMNILLIKITVAILLFVCLCQFFPNYESLHSLIFSRSTTDFGRGLTSILSEPSFLAATASIILINYILLRGPLDLFDPVSLALVFLLLLSFSTMAIFGIIAIFWGSRYSKATKLIFVCLMLAFVWPLVSDLNVRMIEFLISIGKGEPLDQSASSRAFYILKDLQVAKDSFFLPIWGVGGYSHAMQNLMDIEPPKDFMYDPFLSGSLLGRYLVNFGFFIILVPFFYFHKANKKKLLTITFYISLICAISFQMIPTGLIPFNLFLGSSMALLYDVTRCKDL